MKYGRVWRIPINMCVCTAVDIDLATYTLLETEKSEAYNTGGGSWLVRNCWLTYTSHISNINFDKRMSVIGGILLNAL